MNISHAIEVTRYKKNYTQKGLSEKVGVGENYFRGLNAGHFLPSMKALEKICEALEIPAAFIFLLAMEKQDIPKSMQQKFDTVFPQILELLLELTEGKIYLQKEIAEKAIKK